MDFKRILNWSAVFLWMGVIFYFSSLSIIKANNLDILDFIFKKSAHMVEFAVLFFLFYNAFVVNKFHQSTLAAIFYAFLDETHQLFTPGRGATLRDVGFDVLGIIIAHLLINRLNQIDSQKKNIGF